MARLRLLVAVHCGTHVEASHLPSALDGDLVLPLAFFLACPSLTSSQGSLVWTICNSHVFLYVYLLRWKVVCRKTLLGEEEPLATTCCVVCKLAAPTPLRMSTWGISACHTSLFGFDTSFNFFARSFKRSFLQYRFICSRVYFPFHKILHATRMQQQRLVTILGCLSVLIGGSSVRTRLEDAIYEVVDACSFQMVVIFRKRVGGGLPFNGVQGLLAFLFFPFFE